MSRSESGRRPRQLVVRPRPSGRFGQPSDAAYDAIARGKSPRAMNLRPFPRFTAGQAAGDSDGFTLVELMIALALAAILLASTAPNWGAFVATAETRDR